MQRIALCNQLMLTNILIAFVLIAAAFTALLLLLAHAPFAFDECERTRRCTPEAAGQAY